MFTNSKYQSKLAQYLANLELQTEKSEEETPSSSFNFSKALTHKYLYTYQLY